MNLTFRYARKKCGNDFYDLIEYFEKLAFRNKKIISKYCQLLNVEEVYSRLCVKKLPLTLLYKKDLPSCDNPRGCIRYRYDNRGNRWTDRDPKCLLCWISTLENIDVAINKEELLNLPPFLKSKSKPATRPTSLLKKKELPSYLKK